MTTRITPCARIAKIADGQSDIDRRLAALEAKHLRTAGPERLVKAAREAGDRLQAQAQGRAYHAPLPEAHGAKAASGGQRLVQRATEVAKAYRAAQAAQHSPQPGSAAPVVKASASPAQRLILAAQERAAAMRKAG